MQIKHRPDTIRRSIDKPAPRPNKHNGVDFLSDLKKPAADALSPEWLAYSRRLERYVRRVEKLVNPDDLSTIRRR